MWKIRANQIFLINLLFISAILFNVQLIHTETINGTNSLETYLPDQIPNEDAIINSTQTSLHITTISSIEEDEIQSTANIPQSTIQIEENPTLIITDETTKTIENNIKHEILKPPLLSVVESQIIHTTTEISDSKLSFITTRLLALAPDIGMVKVQKCCPHGQIMVLGQPGEKSICQISDKDFNLPVFDVNSTHYWNYTNTAADDVEIIDRNPCNESKYFLDPSDENDTFRILTNFSLYIPFSMSMYDTNQYCVDTIQGSDESFTTAVICTAHPNVDIFHYVYIAGFFVSIISLIGLIVYKLRRKDIKEDHKKFLAFYAGSMAIAYVFITLQTIWHNKFNYNVNLLIAYLIYYFNLNYYLWLNMFTIDTYRCVRNPNIKLMSYMKWYQIATFLIPLIFVLFSFIDRFNPPLPNLYLGHKFSSSIVCIILLYSLPVFVSITANIFIIFKISLPQERYKNVKDLIANLQSKHWNPPPRNIKEIRKMHRRICFLFVEIFILFIFDMVICFLPSEGKQEVHFVIRDSIYCLQGFIISATFIKSDCCKSSARHDNPIANESEMVPMANSNV